MNFPFYIAKRYLVSKSSNNAINFITIIAAIGVIIGAAALFIVLSGFAGLKDFTLKFSSFADPDMKIIPAKGKSLILSPEEFSEISKIEDIASYSKIIEEQVLLNFEDKHESVLLKGVDENYPQKTIDSILLRGNWLKQNSNEIVAGSGVSYNLSFGVLDFAKSLTIYVPKPGKGQITSKNGAYNSMNAFNVGTFQINEDLDYAVVFTNFNAAKYLLNYSDNQLSAIEIVLKDNAPYENVEQQLSTLLGNSVVIKNRLQLNDSLYKMLNAEHLAVYLIFTLILIIALFNVIGSIIMMILDKKKNLNTLFNLGVSLKNIQKIFFFQGSLMSIIGGIIGVILGFLLVLNQSYGPDFLKVFITPSLPYPVSIKWVNLLIVFLTISVLGVIASKIASSRISKKIIA